MTIFRTFAALAFLAVACGSQQRHSEGTGGSGGDQLLGGAAGDAGQVGDAGAGTTGGRGGAGATAGEGGTAGNNAAAAGADDTSGGDSGGEAGASGRAGWSGSGDAGAGGSSDAGAGGSSDAGGAGDEGGRGGSFSGILDLSGIDPTLLGYPRPQGMEEARARAAGIVAGLTIDEKLLLVQGSGSGYYVGGVPAVGPLHPLTLQDGPAGVARLVDVTAFPAPITIAASWDRELARRWGSAMGSEERGKGVVIQLGPMMNLSRTPQGGRNFEGFGEDPYLSAELAAEDVRGIQENHIVATAKHFVGNEQETERMGGNSLIDERTLHEIYYLPFEASVSAGVGAVMCSYNRLNGVYACENPTALGDLKSTLGFFGFVMSDWSATPSTVGAANAGLDMEMPYGSYFGTPLRNAIGASVAASRLDDMATRIVTALAYVGALDDWTTGSAQDDVTSEEHTAVALEGATAGITLLKNDDAALPFGSDVKSIAVFGSGAKTPYTSGEGSAYVYANSVKSPIDAMEERVPSGTDVTYVPPDAARTQVLLAAAQSDAAVVFVSAPSSEGWDHGLALGADDELITMIAGANPRTTVVLNVPGAVMMPWLDDVAGVLVAWYPGQEAGTAITSVLFGDTNPSGKLPVTFPRTPSDLPVPTSGNVTYGEKLALGYRHFDALVTEPLFEFGFGLSYTTFAYSELELGAGASAGSVAVSFRLENTGTRAGSEVAQVYLGYPESAGEPPRVLRGFARIHLDAGEHQRVHIELPARAFACWSATLHTRYAPSGTYRIEVGGSSRSLPSVAELQVTGLGEPN